MDTALLEELIIRAALEPGLRPRLIEALMASRLAVPLDKGLENGALPADFKPLTLNAQQGFPVLAVFTNPSKVTPWLKEQPAFQHSLVTSFSWAISITRPPFGIAVNPGYRHSLVLSPTEVEALRSTR
ncbi:SseB family protein [Pseudoxanthomonas gei]|uniref:SseB family protein n=1 Tax=Pseudoxanthomonas gei TaxID=1383030 RepID=A0ABX0AGZ9_9GAMM|nr:SseB family protein [Pseudoxanthomonas gei]NDK39745.1 SseB family protein [Pseudoxanthomonas gei]